MPDIDHKVHLSYQDILLVPPDQEPCSIRSRQDPDISAEICSGKKIKIPIISAPMDTVTGYNMMVAMHYAGGLGIHTRHINDQEELPKQCSALAALRNVPVTYRACAVGIRNSTYDNLKALCDAGANIICFDIANGNHIFMLEALERMSKIQQQYPEVSSIAGNVATGKAARRLAEAGANAIKCGIGPGGACITRRIIGFGVPQLTAVMDCAEALSDMKSVRLIADGGIRFPSDVIKAIWAGADTVMLGYVLAGHLECPIVSENHDDNPSVPKRTYRGMASRTVHGRSDVASEGICVELEFRGSVQNTIGEYAKAIKAAFAFGNANNANEFRQNVKAIRVSTVSHKESNTVMD